MLTLAVIPAAELSRLKSTHLHVLQGLLVFADAEGRCWPSLRKLAETVGMSLSRVQRAVAEMAALGYLAIRKRGTRSHLYQIAARFLTRRVPLKRSPASDTPEAPVAAALPPAPAAGCSASGTEGNPGKENKDFKQEGVAIPLRRASAPPWHAATPELKARRKEMLQQKLGRYLACCGRPGEAEAYWTAMLDPDLRIGQRMLDVVDRRMRASGWDDGRERRAA